MRQRGLERPMRWLEGPMTLVLWLAFLASFLMMVHVSIDVIARSVFNSPIEGTSEIVTYWYMVTAAFLPWMWLAKGDGHIKVDLFVQLLSDPVKFWLDVVVQLGLVVYLGLFTWQTAIQAIRQTGRGEVQQAGTLYIPVWPTRWLLPIAGGLMALWVVLATLDRVLKRMRR